MARTSPAIQLEEISGDQFPALDAAQDFARSMLASFLAETVKRMIESGKLEIVENQIKPKGK